MATEGIDIINEFSWNAQHVPGDCNITDHDLL